MAAKKPDPIDPAATGDEDVVEVVDIETETFEIEEDAADRYGYVDPLGPGLFARAAIEALGTFVLVLVTLATALYLPLFGVDTLGAVLAPGLVLVGLMVAFGHVSGGHFNPAVTLGAALAGRVAWLDSLLYWVAQVFGGVVAGAIVFATVPSELPGLLGADGARGLMDTIANGWGDEAPLAVLSQLQVTFDWRAALILEAIAAAILMAVWLGSTSRRASRGSAPFAVGLTYGALLITTATVTGGALNPARSTGAALFSEGAALGQVWLFWLAPLLGAAIAGLIYVAAAAPAEDEPVFEDFDDDEDEDTVRL